MKKIAPVILSILMLVLAEEAAFADVRWGIGGEAVTGYDSNITFVKNDPKEDMVSKVTVGAEVNQEGKNNIFNVKAGVTQNIYSKNSTYNNLSEQLSASYLQDLNAHEQIKVQEYFSHSEDPRNFEDAFGRPTGRYSTYQNRINLGYKRVLTKQWNYYLRYNQTNYILTRDDLSDSVLYNPGYTVEYDFSSRDQGMINYDYRRREFNPGGAANTHSPSVGWRHYLTKQWYLNGLVGVDFINGFGQDYIKPHFEASITNDIDINTQLTLSYNRQYEADAFNQEIFNNSKVMLALSRQLTNRLSTNVSGFYGDGKYQPSGITSKLTGANVDFAYALNKHTDVTVSYTYQVSESNVDNREYRRNAVFAGLKFKF